jgi:[protein-PII] uridylyltransferase
MTTIPPANQIHLLREQHKRDKKALLEGIQNEGGSTRGIRRTLQQLSHLADGLLRELWAQSGLGADHALVAVGGFGRGELFPYSDVDVLVLLPDDADPESDPALKAQLEQFIGWCWDSGLDIGSSVRKVSECVEEALRDVTVQTSTLESRLVCGSRQQYKRLVTALNEAMNPKAFFVAKTLEMRQRHQRQENTPYALEPNCKEAPGGLRDLQIISGWPRQPVWGAAGTSWAARDWPHRWKCANSRPMRHC